MSEKEIGSVPPAPTTSEVFTNYFSTIESRAAAINIRNGFWDKRTAMRRSLAETGEFKQQELDALFGIHLIGLIHTELSEAVEALRKPAEPLGSLADHSVARELAGAIVRIMDMSYVMGIPVGAAIIRELDNNETRGRMHGKNIA